MPFPRSAGFPPSACAVDEPPALLGSRTCCWATCVISRLRRASVFGLRRKRNSNFDRILHRLPGRLRCFLPLLPFLLQLALSMELQLRHVAPPVALLVAKLQSSPDIDSKPRPRLRTNLRIQLGFPPPAEPTADPQLPSKIVSPAEAVDPSSTSVERLPSTQPSTNSQSRSNFLFAASRL